jgi:maleylacetate reductase
MTLSFVHQANPTHVVFGSGAIRSTGRWIGKIGCRRALMLSTRHQKADAEVLADALGDLAVGVFGNATMHTPVDVTEEAVAQVAGLNADCIVSLGGGSTTGLGKAIAWRTGLPQIAIPTTYAGSEVTPILGQTEKGEKTTLRSRTVLPVVVIYDPDITLPLPVGISATSGLNAIAHAAEALYAPDRSPVSSLLATEGMRAFKEALPKIVNDPRDRDARAKALYGAWLCGTVLGQVGMALHHKICHTLGGSFNTPHAETHSIMLPHTVGFNAAVAVVELAPISEVFGGSPGQALFDFGRSVGSPAALQEIGLKESDLDSVAEIATRNPYTNPRPVDRRSIREILQRAWEGRRPPL